MLDARDGAMVDLGTLGGDRSEASAINDHGQIVGASTTASGDFHVFVWDRGLMIDPGDSPGGSGFRTPDINNRGQIVGMHDDQAVLWARVHRSGR